MLSLQEHVSLVQLRSSTSIYSGIQSMYDDVATSDTVVQPDAVTLHAHKAILAAQSPFFKGMFQVSPLHCLKSIGRLKSKWR